MHRTYLWWLEVGYTFNLNPYTIVFFCEIHILSTIGLFVCCRIYLESSILLLSTTKILKFYDLSMNLKLIVFKKYIFLTVQN